MRRHDDPQANSSKLRPITREQISALAHAIWQDRGCPQGSDLDIWLEAERQLKGEVSRPVAKDHIPADPASAGDPNTDPALNPRIDRNIDELPPRGDDKRSPTSL